VGHATEYEKRRHGIVGKKFNKETKSDQVKKESQTKIWGKEGLKGNARKKSADCSVSIPHVPIPKRAVQVQKKLRQVQD